MSGFVSSGFIDRSVGAPEKARALYVRKGRRSRCWRMVGASQRLVFHPSPQPSPTTGEGVASMFEGPRIATATRLCFNVRRQPSQPLRATF